MLARATFSDYIIGLLFAAQVGVAQIPQIKEAFEAFTAGDYRTALKLYTEALDANPKSATRAAKHPGCTLQPGCGGRWQDSSLRRSPEVCKGIVT